MERERGFAFKLLVPRGQVSGQVSGQVNAVPPRGVDEDLRALKEGFSKCNNKPNMAFLNSSVAAPSRPLRPDFPKMKAVSPMEKEKNKCGPGELYSKMFDEFEKIKCWKIKVDSDTVHQERRLQDNKRTIEAQRKAIQELQFGNESLSIKLEEQISENEDLRNRNNATRNLCETLKETFQWSTEKMHFLESEREETHHLFTENTESVKKLIAAFDSLHIQVEADQQEMQKVKESLLQFEDLKEKWRQEHAMKDEKIVVLQTKIEEKENELEKVLLDLDKSHKYCKQLQESIHQQLESLKNSNSEKESLLQNLHAAEQCCKETKKTKETIAATLDHTKKEYEQMIQSKDLSIQELSRVKHQQAEKLEEIQSTIQELQNSKALETQRAKNLEDKLVANNYELEKTTILLGETMEQVTKKDDLIKILEDDLEIKSKSAESLKSEIDIYETRVDELVAAVSNKEEGIQIFKIKMQELEEQLSAQLKKKEECNSQMEQLKKDLVQHEMKYGELLLKFKELQSEKMTIQKELEDGLSSVKIIDANRKLSEEKENQLNNEIQRLEEENLCLQDEVNTIKTTIIGAHQETETLQKTMEGKFHYMQTEMTKNEKCIKALEAKLSSLKKKNEIKYKAQEECKQENKMLKKQIAKGISKSSELEKMIDRLEEECQNYKTLKDNDQQKLLKDLKSKSTFAAELENEVKRLRLTAAEAVQNKEDLELKCQHKIAEMVALMERHKSQYDRMVEEKDRELDENKKKEMETVAHAKSLESHLSKLKTDNELLKKQLEMETTEKENLQKKQTDLMKEMSAVKMTQSSTQRDKSAVSNYKEGRGIDTPENTSKSCIFDFPKTRTTPSDSNGVNTPVLMKDILGKDKKTPGSKAKSSSGALKTQSYRVRTPPSNGKAAPWGKSAIELEPKSDSSDHTDLLMFAKVPERSVSALQSKRNIFRKIKSPVDCKSPGNSLKLAAMKRIRDAGWTAVTGSDQKKKKSNEKIFA
ncbi:synaptonemal complex protein 1-like [Cololabis saira]|uniref:synaptonemal complex protein 1-like n=1 Tax=Cololabis saira TaxID=129043 RepID=UPI002AD2F428|nr:synaptonemal complex protein 1-like [Cololabis saira]